MITDQETNFVYFSKTLKQEKYSAFLKNLTGILKTNNIEYDFLSYTNDIWCKHRIVNRAISYTIQVEREHYKGNSYLGQIHF